MAVSDDESPRVIAAEMLALQRRLAELEAAVQKKSLEVHLLRQLVEVLREQLHAGRDAGEGGSG